MYMKMRNEIPVNCTVDLIGMGIFRNCLSYRGNLRKKARALLIAQLPDLILVFLQCDDTAAAVFLVPEKETRLKMSSPPAGS